MYKGILTITDKYDEGLEYIVDYEEFTKGIEVDKLNKTTKTTDAFKTDISTKLEVSEDKKEQIKLDILDTEEKRLFKEAMECSIQYKQEQIEKLKQEITDMKILLSKNI